MPTCLSLIMRITQLMLHTAARAKRRPKWWWSLSQLQPTTADLCCLMQALFCPLCSRLAEKCTHNLLSNLGAHFQMMLFYHSSECCSLVPSVGTICRINYHVSIGSNFVTYWTQSRIRKGAIQDKSSCPLRTVRRLGQQRVEAVADLNSY